MTIRYAMEQGGGAAGVLLEGDDLRAVIEGNIADLARQAGVGSAAGYHLCRIRCERHGNEIAVAIVAQGLPCVAGTAGEARGGVARLRPWRWDGPADAEIAAAAWDWPALDAANPEHYYDICHPQHPRHIPHP